MQPSPNPEQTPQVSAPIPMDPIAAAKMQAGMRDVYLKEAYNAVGSNFYTIAVLSIINSVIALFKGNIYFPVGLGLTQIVDVFASALSQEAGSSIFLIIGFVIDLFILGIVAVFGFFIKRKVKWLISVGSVLYLLDGLILLGLMSMLLHGLGSAVAQKQFLCRKIQRGHLDVDDRFLTIEVDCLMYRDLSVAQALQLIDVPVVVYPDQ